MKCVYCGHDVDVIADQKESALVSVIKMSGRFGAHSGLVWEYALLWIGARSIRDRELKLARVLGGLLDLWDGGRFGYQKKAYQITPPGIVSALKTVLDRNLSGPLESDNYLKKVMVQISEEEDRARSIEAEKALREKEKALRAGKFVPDRYGAGPDHPPRGTDEPDWDQGKRQIGNILKSIPSPGGDR